MAGGLGSVSSSPGGITCGSDCSDDYAAGTVVTLTASPALLVTGWSGCDTVVGRDLHGDHAGGPIRDRHLPWPAAAAVRVDEMRRAVAAIERDVAEGAIVPDVGPGDIRAHLESRYDFAAPVPLDAAVADVEAMMRRWHVQVTHPRYFGLFNPSVTPASVIADTLVAAYNPQLAAWRTSPAANEIERHTLRWLAAKFGLPPSTSATFTSGGAEANLSAVVLALTRAFPEYGEDGLRGMDGMPAIYLTSQAHDSFYKIAHMTGIGRQALRLVATDGDLKMDVSDLARRIDDDRRHGWTPVMVVATAGTTAAGAIDPLRDIAACCGARAAVASRRRRLGRRGDRGARDAPSSRRHRGGRFHYLRRAQRVLGADGRRHVLLPAPAGRGRGVSRAHRLHAAGVRRIDGRSLYHLGAMVAPLHRPEAVSRARRARRDRLRRDDRPAGAHGRTAA